MSELNGFNHHLYRSDSGATGHLPALLLALILFPVATPLCAETLAQAWDTAITYDHALKSVQRQSEAAAQNLAAARAVRIPSVDLKSGYRVLDNTPTAKAAFGGQAVEFPVAEQNSFSASAMTTLPIYTSGRIGNGIDAADALLQASRGDEQTALQDLKLATAERYVGVLRAQRNTAVAQTDVRNLQGHYRDVRSLGKQGMVPRNDVLAVEAALADAKQRRLRASNALDIAHSAYNRLLGRPMAAAVELDELPESLPVAELQALNQAALEHRSELKVLSDQVQALQHQARVTRAADGPQIALQGGYQFQDNQFQVHQGVWSVNLGLSWNIFDGGLTRRQGEALQRQALALQERLQDLHSRILLQVRQAWLNLNETRQRVQVTQSAIQSASENLRVMRARYHEGLATNTEVLDAESLDTRSESNYADARYDFILAGLRLQRAVGQI